MKQVTTTLTPAGYDWLHKLQYFQKKVKGQM